MKSVLIIFLFAIGCARSPIKSDDQAMRLAKPPMSLQDDLRWENLAVALKANIERLKSYGSPVGTMRFGPVEISRDVYRAGLERLVAILETDPSGAEFNKVLQEEYEFYEVYGGDTGWGDVFITSYYEPIIPGRLKKSPPYTQPVYGKPKDLVTVDMGAFADTFTSFRPFYDSVIVQKSRDGLLRGRLLAANEDPTNKNRVLPYYTREEIDSAPVLEGKAQILCYVDPVDAFFLQIQGSGRIHLQDLGLNSKTAPPEIRLGYAEQNGHTYMAIGKFLMDVIPKEKMSAQRIAAHLRSLPPAEAQKIMGMNPSYVFFQKQQMAAVSAFGIEAVPGRTIATDMKYFPKGALAFLEYEMPVFIDDTSSEVQNFVKSSRFVLDQDTGGAIRGPGRLDLFWGSGSEAARVSGVMRNPGRLYYILPKKRAL